MNNYIHYVQDDRYYADSSYSNGGILKGGRIDPEGGGGWGVKRMAHAVCIYILYNYMPDMSALCIAILSVLCT